MTFSHLPKVELHLHLDCCLSYNAVRALDPTVTEAIFREQFIAPAKCTSLADYLRYPPRSVALLQTADALRIAVDDVFEQLAADQVLYAEIRFAPFLHVAQGLALPRIVEAVERAVEQAIARTGIQARVILCTLRHFDAQQSLQTAQLVKEFRGSHVVAFDIAGDEAGYPLEPHVAAFRLIQEAGLAITAHAGEARGADSVWETLDQLHPTRIGHGVRSIEDPRLLQHLRAHRIHLEMCPSSNLQTNLCPTLAQHPIDQLYQNQVSLSVSTDTRTITDITLNQEYAQLSDTFQWGVEHFQHCNLEALAASFAPEALKQTLKQKLLESYAHG